MNAHLATVITFAALAGGLLAVALLPRWYGISVERHKLWRVRDDAYDARLGGRLPDHPAVSDFILEVEGAIQFAHELSFGKVVFAGWRMSHMPEQDLETLVKYVERPSMSGLDAGERRCLQELRSRYRASMIRIVFMGTWLGLAVGALSVVGVLWSRLRDGRQRPIHVSTASFVAVLGKEEAVTKHTDIADDIIFTQRRAGGIVDNGAVA